MSVATLVFDTFTEVFDSDCDTTVEKDVLGGPGVVHSLSVSNPQDTYFYLWVFDSVDPTLGTTSPVMVIRVEKNATGALNEGYCHMRIPEGEVCETALSIAGSTSSDGTGDPGTSVEVSLEAVPG